MQYEMDSTPPRLGDSTIQLSDFPSFLFLSTFIILSRTHQINVARSKTLPICSLHHSPLGYLGGKKMCWSTRVVQYVPDVQELLMECR